MNTFTNDGSFMEQFLKKQKVTHDPSETTTTTTSTKTDDAQQQPPAAYDYSQYYGQGYDEAAAYYQDPAYAAYYAQYQQQQQSTDGSTDYSSHYQQMDQTTSAATYQMGAGGAHGMPHNMGGHRGGGGGVPSSTQPSRVIWAGNTHPDATEDEIKQLFGTYGYIKYVKLVPAKRYSFITFADLNSSIQAQFELNGHMLRGLPLKLGFGKSEVKESVGYDNQNPPCKNLWIGNVAMSVTDDSLRELFEQFGKVEYVRILAGRQCAFVSFQDVETATAAKQAVQGRNFHGLNLAINFRRETESDRERGGAPQSGFDQQQQQQPFNKKERFGGGEGGGGRGFRERFNNDQQNRDGNPMPAPPPASAGLQTIIDKLAVYVAKNGPRFESYTQDKQKNNSQFDFLKPTHPSHDYYRWKLWTIKNPDAHSSDRNQINQFVPPTQQQQSQPQPQPQQQQQYQEQQTFNPPPQQSYLNEQQVQEFKDMLEKLNLSKGSITSCKAWIMNHIQHALEIISIITTTHQKGSLKFSQKLNILYVLNDSLHNCLGRRRGDSLDEFADAIKDYLPFIIASTSAGETHENQEKVLKVLNIWENQKIYPKKMIDDLKMAATDEG